MEQTTEVSSKTNLEIFSTQKELTKLEAPIMRQRSMYNELTTRNADGEAQTRSNHIMEHRNDFKVKLGNTDWDTVISKLAEIGESQDTTKILEYRMQRNGYLMRADVEMGFLVFIKDKPDPNQRDKYPPPPYIVTAYLPPDDVRKAFERKQENDIKETLLYKERVAA